MNFKKDRMNDEIKKRYVADVSQLSNRLAELNIGDEITYSELSDLIGINVRTEGYRAFLDARKALRKDGKEFYTIQGVGIRRATKEDCLKMSSGQISQIRKRARNGSRINNNVPDVEKLSPNEKALLSASSTIFAITLQTTKPSKQKELGILYTHNPALLTEEAAKRTLEGLK